MAEAMALDERASEGEDADLDDVDDFKSEESEPDDEATLEEEEVGYLGTHLQSVKIPSISNFCLDARKLCCWKHTAQEPIIASVKA